MNLSFWRSDVRLYNISKHVNQYVRNADRSKAISPDLIEPKSGLDRDVVGDLGDYHARVTTGEQRPNPGLKAGKTVSPRYEPCASVVCLNERDRDTDIGGGLRVR
jgi:hypothetical protein